MVESRMSRVSVRWDTEMESISVMEETIHERRMSSKEEKKRKPRKEKLTIVVLHKI